MFWAMVIVAAAVVVFFAAFLLFPWGREARNPEKDHRWLFLGPGRGA